MKKTVKANLLDIIGLVVGIVGLVVGLAVFPNWESHYDFELSFGKNVSEKYSSYYAVEADSLQMYQDEGNSDCRYTLYYQQRTAKSWTMIVSQLRFDENGEWDGATYSLQSSWWCDVRFKVQKTAGTNIKSVLCFSLGQSTD